MLVMFKLFHFNIFIKKVVMKNAARRYHSATVSSSVLLYWKFAQILFWIVGVGLLFCLLFFPAVGLILFWNILIPLAPALLVTVTGVWRNICPLATTAIIPDRLGLSKKKKLSFSQRNKLNLVGVTALLLIIPFRHVLFNTSGLATALMLIFISAIAVALGFIYERKSVWCSGLCPVHPVEKLYGSGVALSLPNVHCVECVKCAIPCPDSTFNITPLAFPSSATSKATEIILVGAFPGYIWGWFQVPDYINTGGWQHPFIVYGYPLVCGVLTLLLYLCFEKVFKKNKKLIIRLFAAAAVSCYYWFRLPQLFGFGAMHSNGILLNLAGYLPGWSMNILNLVTTAFFVWWMVIRNKGKKSWSLRPAYAKP